jgi:hypothetical protein
MLVHGIGHEHPHVHPHPHRGKHRRDQPHVPQRGAVLDIGGDVGAVLVVAGPALDGAEIELYDEHGSYVMHTEVHGREVMGKRQYAGLFPSVREGTYLLDTADGAPRERVVVSGGQVARTARVEPAGPGEAASS